MEKGEKVIKCKMKKIIIALFCTGIMLVTERRINCYTAIAGIDVTITKITKESISDVYTYGKKDII